MNSPSRTANASPSSERGASATPHSILQRLLLTCGIVGPILFTAIYLIEGALHPSYDLLRQPISNLEGVSNGWTQSANFILFGLFIIGFAVALRKELTRGFGVTSLPLLQGLVALGLIISGVFTHDPLHTSGDILSFSALFVNCLVFARRFAGDPLWRGWATYTLATGVMMMLFVIAFGIAQSHGGPAGLFERLAVLVRSVWTIWLAARLLAQPGRLVPLETSQEPAHA